MSFNVFLVTGFSNSVRLIRPEAATSRTNDRQSGSTDQRKFEWFLTLKLLSDWSVRQATILLAWSRCSGDRENVVGVGNYSYVASALRRARRWVAHGGGEGRWHVLPRAQLVSLLTQWLQLRFDGCSTGVRLFITGH